MNGRGSTAYPASELHDQKRLRRTLMLAALLVAVTQTIFAASALAFGRSPMFWMPAAHALLCMGGVVALTFWTPKTSRMISLFSVSLIAPAFLVIWFRHSELAAMDVTWSPFQGIKLLMIGLAFIVPGPYWLNFMLMTAFLIQAFLLWWVLDLGALATAATANEPWFTLMFYVVAAGLLTYRWRHEALERRFWNTEIRSRMLTDIAHMFLRVRDQANTPLQNLQLGLALLKAKGESPEITAPMERAVSRLTELSQEFSKYEDAIDWSGDELTEGDQQQLAGSLREEDRRRDGER
jgi:hypothetical protein